MKKSMQLLLIVVLTSLLLVTPLAALAAPTDGAPAAASCTYYTVRAGDTLTKIAARYHTDVWTIARANGITNLNRIHIGQVLCIPAASTPPACPISYVVQRGDTLTKIASRFRVSVLALRSANQIGDINRIYVGQRLRIPCNPPPPPTPPPPSSAAWTAKFYNNEDLSGAPVLTRRDTGINFNWGYGSPAPSSVQADHFSAQWSRSAAFSGGTYRFYARSDDGVRLWVDGVNQIDEWREQAIAGFYKDVVLNQGSHTVVVEYFERTGLAEIHVWWEKR
ncbi:MAG: LysM peptidoglycan-binding domain-containing protein [Anaerolineae bacterium]|nr:LysM peptidoglycan-binding domain-containing protein [Anaerolineae bacterium]